MKPNIFLTMGERTPPKKATFCYYQNKLMSIKAQFKPFLLPTTGAHGGHLKLYSIYK